MKKFIISGVIASVMLWQPVYAQPYQDDMAEGFVNAPHVLRMRIPNTTQGPIWPPSALTNADGDFIVVGWLLESDGQGGVFPNFGAAAIVDKNTVPPLDANGRENFTNPFGAPYTIKRRLDLSPGSPDLDMIVHTNSYGPHTGDFGGGPRIPREGDSDYNLNSFSTNGDNCPDLYPAESQRESYTRPSYPLHEAPILGFQGDDVAFDADTGEEFIPRFRNGAECFPDGCPGEDPFHSRRQEPITLGEWLEADVFLTVRLTGFDREQDAYTAAHFRVVGRNLLPNSIYTLVLSRNSFLLPSPIQKLPHPATMTSHMFTDSRGRGSLSFELVNPFPDPMTDDAGMRVIGLGMSYKSEFAVFGGCGLRLGAGVDVHAVVLTTASGDLDFTDFITVAPRQ
ncbi:MAG: hypothetical protein Tsb002_35070 [Wenzhouxiangellaceae bacterium]